MRLFIDDRSSNWAAYPVDDIESISFKGGVFTIKITLKQNYITAVHGGGQKSVIFSINANIPRREFYIKMFEDICNIIADDNIKKIYLRELESLGSESSSVAEEAEEPLSHKKRVRR
ncbi:hypothetical protein [Methanocalculus sp. MC3]